MNRAAAYDKRRGVSSATGNRTSMTGMAGRTTNHTANRLAFSCASSSSSSVVLTARFTDDAVVRRRTATLPKSSTGGSADGRFVYHSDALGSVAAITDELQATVRTYTYEAFGKLRATTGTGPVGGNRFTYTGREPLGDSQSLYYYRWRVMDPNLGRFTSEDPLGFVPDLHLFTYVGNRPLERLDPLGLTATAVPPWVWPVAGGAAVIDGPLPIGDIIAIGIVVTAKVVVEVCKFEEIMKCKSVGMVSGMCIYKCPDGSISIGVPSSGPIPCPDIYKKGGT